MPRIKSEDIERFRGNLNDGDGIDPNDAVRLIDEIEHQRADIAAMIESVKDLDAAAQKMACTGFSAAAWRKIHEAIGIMAGRRKA